MPGGTRLHLNGKHSDTIDVLEMLLYLPLKFYCLSEILLALSRDTIGKENLCAYIQLP